MEKIKFKAKALGTGEWVYGYYAMLSNEFKSWHGILTDKDSQENYIKDCNGFNILYTAVDPATIGQFSGLCDKKGRDIYEGDIVEYGLRLYMCEFIEGGFEFRDISDGRLTLNAIAYMSCIVGNIHDNKYYCDKKEQ